MPKVVFNEETKEYDIQYEKAPEEVKGGPVFPYQDQMFIRKLYGGLPIYTTSSGIKPMVGQIYLIDSGSKRICVRFDNIVVSASLT